MLIATMCYCLRALLFIYGKCNTSHSELGYICIIIVRDVCMAVRNITKCMLIYVSSYIIYV